MKSPFQGYYQPTAEEYGTLWEEALIVLDTNVLLNLYRLPISAREEVIGVLEKLNARLWIPHHVGLEFQRRRLTVISKERKDVESVLSKTDDVLEEIKKNFSSLQIEKRNLDISPEILNNLDKASKELIEAIKKVHDSQLDISSDDPVRQVIDRLFDGKIGDGPASQAILDKLVEGGEDRYREKIPPGYMDADKEKNPNEANFFFDGIKFQRKFGDLIIWRQLMQYTQANKTKYVLFVTADKKEDWWWNEFGRTIGPHPELIREIQKTGGVKIFWMYSFVQFIEQANKYISASVSTKSVDELQSISTEYQEVRRSKYFAAKNYAKTNFFGEIKRSKYYINKWLVESGYEVSITNKFPDFIVMKHDGPHGYDVKNVNNFDRFVLSPLVINSLLKGYIEKGEGRLNKFTLVIVIPEDRFFDIKISEDLSDLHRKLENLLVKYPAHSIVVGAIVEDDFQVLIKCKHFGSGSHLTLF